VKLSREIPIPGVKAYLRADARGTGWSDVVLIGLGRKI